MDEEAETAQVLGNGDGGERVHVSLDRAQNGCSQENEVMRKRGKAYEI